jgi:hypothetical protein
VFVTSTVNWKIFDVEVAATMAAETMAVSGRAGEVSADITKLRKDVLKQSIASLAGFIGGVNYSNTFHMSAANQDKLKSGGGGGGSAVPVGALATAVPGGADAGDVPMATKSEFLDNPLYDPEKVRGQTGDASWISVIPKQTPFFFFFLNWTMHRETGKLS